MFGITKKDTLKPLFSGHLREWANWPLKRGWSKCREQTQGSFGKVVLLTAFTHARYSGFSGKQWKQTEGSSFFFAWLLQPTTAQCGILLRQVSLLSLILLFMYIMLGSDELLKDTGHGSRIILSKYHKISSCNWLRDHLIQLKYNKISQLGVLNGDRVRLIGVTA